MIRIWYGMVENDTKGIVLIKHFNHIHSAAEHKLIVETVIRRRYYQLALRYN